MIKFLFWLSIFAIVWAYFGYPLSLWALNRIRGQRKASLSFNVSEVPFATILIAAANEEQTIGDKLLNTLKLNYPKDMFEIILSLDGSTDNTYAEAHNHIDEVTNGPNITCHYEKTQRGKEHALQAGFLRSKGEIVIVTDVASMLEPGTILQLINHFKDQEIGAIDGMAKISSSSHSSEGLYLKYENKIREWEGNLTSITGMGGCLFAARRQILAEVLLRPDLQSDFRTALITRELGYRAEIDREAIATFKDTKDSGKEFRRKVRTAVRGYNVFFNHLSLLNPLKYGLFSYQMFCHRLLKWSVPFWLIIAFAANFFLITNHWVYLLLLLGQLVFYISAWAARNMKLQNFKVLNVIKFLTMANIALLKAWLEYASGKRYVSWSATKR